MTTLDERIIYGIGNGKCRRIENPDGTFTVEVECNKGVTSMAVATEVESFHAFMHPFDRESRLTPPGSDEHPATRELTAAEYALAEAIEDAEAGDFDVAR